MEEEKSRKFVLPNGETISVTVDDLEYIFKGYRPRSMSSEVFRFISRTLKKDAKKYLRGRMIHLSKVTDVIWKEYVGEMQYKPIQKGRTYVKKGK